MAATKAATAKKDTDEVLDEEEDDSSPKMMESDELKKFIEEGPDAPNISELNFAIRSRNPLLWVTTREEPRFLAILKDMCRGSARKLVIWDRVSGASEFDHKEGKLTQIQGSGIPCITPEQFLEWADTDTNVPTRTGSQQGRGALYVALDLGNYFGTSSQGAMGDQEMGIIRGLKNVCQSRQFNGGKVEGEKKMNKHILIVSRNSDVPDDLKELTTVVEWNLPSSPWILAEVTRLIIQLDKKICSTRRAEERSAANTEVKKDKEAKLKKAAGMVCPLVPEDAPALTRAFQGMTGAEISTAFKQCSVRIGSERTEDSIERFISFVNESKKQIIKKSGSGLEVYDAKVDESDIGGLPILKDWLRRRTPAFTDEARAFGIDAPKGLLLIGIPGCGKSLTAKAAASIWNLPLLRLDMGTIFRGIVGSSEAAIRDAIRTAEAMAPCVLWMDEAEKSLSGTGSSDMSDAGTTARVFATILTWLEEKTSPVFVIMTANDISKLPPELIRKGRLDDMFFVDLPNEGEREEILRIHLSKRNHDPAKFDLTQLVQDTADYSGSELESAIVDALASVFYERSIGAKNRDLTGEDILKSLHETVPLSLTMREKVRALKTWARTRARFATESVVDKQKLTEKMRAKKLELDEEEDDLDVDMDGTEDCPALG